MNKIKIIKDIAEIDSLDNLIGLIQKQMTVIEGCTDIMHITDALENALSPESRSVLFLWFSKADKIGAFAFSNICAGLETGADYLWINEILVGKRKSASESWCLPCGYIEQTENFLEAAHREVKEETNITIRIDEVINIVSNVLKDDLESLVIVLLAEAITTDTSPGDDLIELRWCNADNLPKMEFDADVYIIDTYFQNEYSRIIVDPRYRMLS